MLPENQHKISKQYRNNKLSPPTHTHTHIHIYKGGAKIEHSI